MQRCDRARLAKRDFTWPGSGPFPRKGPESGEGAPWHHLKALSENRISDMYPHRGAGTTRTARGGRRQLSTKQKLILQEAVYQGDWLGILR